jgi:cell division protein FtsB
MGRIVAVGGSSAAIAYGLFCWFGKGWLEQQFNKQLERLKHDQQKEIEQLRHQINSLFSRVSKIHEKGV